MTEMRCEEPGCEQDGLVGLNGIWLCLDDFAKHLERMKAEARALVTKRKEES